MNIAACHRFAIKIALSGFMIPVSAIAGEATHQELEKYRRDQTAYLNEIPTKYSSSGIPLNHNPSPFSPDAIDSKEYINIKDAARTQMMSGLNPFNSTSERSIFWAPVDDGIDNPAEMLDENTLFKTLEAMTAEKIEAGQVKEQPWSGDYWGIYKGNIATRYADKNFPNSRKWQKNYDYVSAHTAQDIYKHGDERTIATLSPSEKYELIVGDDQGKLTSALWSEVKASVNSDGEVEPWFGICHGWAPAAFMLPRPQHSIKVPAKNHKFSVELFPDDIKALASLLWANAKPETHFIGGRCNDKDPPKDENGRVTSAECFDNNPGAWHQVVVGLLGKSTRSMVIDATFDYEVWNQPVSKYSYSYFDPSTGNEVKTLAEGTKVISELPQDRFKKYRSSEAKFLVGVAMELTYMVETAATPARINRPTNDADHTVVYLYDLELDKDKNIIGGEWHSNFHPDFIWAPAKDARAINPVEYGIRDKWQPGQPIPDSWLKPAQYAGERGQVLALVLEELLRQSRAR